MSVITWHVWIDWNQDGIYEDDEGARFCGLGGAIERGREEFFGDPIVGNVDVQLRNEDNRFSPWNTASPLYSLLADNPRLKITCEVDSVTYPLFTGNIEDIKPMGIRAQGASGGNKVVHIVAHDGWQTLADQVVKIALQQNITTKAALVMLLTAIGWDNSGAGIFTLDSSALDGPDVLGDIYNFGTDFGSDAGDTIPFWWSENESAMQNILDLANSIFARVHIANDGDFFFRTLGDDNGAAADLTLTDSMVSEVTPMLLRRDMCNDIAIKATPRELAASASIWSLGETIFINAGETKTFVAEWQAATNIVTPAATTDYTANKLEDGSGTDYTSSLTVAMTATSSSATITVTNNATIGIYITMLQVRGQLVQETDVVAMTAQNTVSIERRRTRKMERELRWQQSVDKAQSWATWAAGYFPTPHYALDVHFESSVIGLAGELGQKIIDGFSNGTGAKYRIGKILHEVPDPAGQQVITTWKLFPCLPDSYFVLDASALDDAAAPIAPW